MFEVSLTIHSPEGDRHTQLTAGRLGIGRHDTADLYIDDPGLSRLHASIYCEGDKVWILDEGSTNGSLVNGERVPHSGKSLADGDKISIGNYTVIWVSLRSNNVTVERAKNPTGIRAAAIAAPVLVLMVIGVALGMHWIRSYAGEREPVVSQETNTSRENTNTPPVNLPVVREAEPDPPMPPPHPSKLYREMTSGEQAEFLRSEARRVSLMVGNRPCGFTDEVMDMIRRDVDAYAHRLNNKSTRMWGEDLSALFRRASRYAPLIIRSFNKEKVNPVVGLYIAMIESEYGLHCRDNFAGAMGMFQFIASTARLYDITNPNDRCNPEKMAPAAARYMRDRLNEFGADATGVALSIAGYNRSPDSVRRDLYNIIGSDSGTQERNFWTLIAKTEKLDHWFLENRKYVPKFFAAAIVGENPQYFGLQMRALSTCSDENDPCFK